MEIVSWQEILPKRFLLDVEGYTETKSDQNYFLTPYFGSLPQNIDSKVKNVTFANHFNLLVCWISVVMDINVI